MLQRPDPRVFDEFVIVVGSPTEVGCLRVTSHSANAILRLASTYLGISYNLNRSAEFGGLMKPVR